jgi:uncharacterized repeat protein (TIGR01451 family)
MNLTINQHQHTLPRRLFFGAFLLLAVLGLTTLAGHSLLGSEAARAAITITVDSTADDTLGTLAGNGTCDLREAIVAANLNTTVGQCTHDGSAGMDTILFDASLAGQTIILGDGQYVITQSVIIDARPATPITIDADGELDSRHFLIQDDNFGDSVPVVVEMYDLILINGYHDGDGCGNPPPANGGGSIYNDYGYLTLDNTTVISNVAEDCEGGGYGGGIYNEAGSVAGGGELTLRNGSLVTNNEATYDGGGIYNETGKVYITDTVISLNWAGNGTSFYGGDGGGILNDNGYVVLNNSHVLANMADYREYVGSGFGGNGGGIYNYGDAYLLLTNGSSVNANQADESGGGIYNIGPYIDAPTAPQTDIKLAGSYKNSILLFDSTVDGNTANADNAYHGGDVGGGIYNSDHAELHNVTVSNNTANAGGGIYTEPYYYAGPDSADSAVGHTLIITHSTISSNTAEYGGGGIYNAYDYFFMTNSTVSGNTVANGYGGGIHNSGDALLANVTVTNNEVNRDDGEGQAEGGGIYESSSTSTYLKNSIVAGNRDNSVNSTFNDTHTPDLGQGYFYSGGYNLIGDIGDTSLSLFTPTTGDQVGGTITTPTTIDPLLGPLADNGGVGTPHTLTHLPQVGSPAIDQANPAGCYEYDADLAPTPLYPNDGTLITIDQRDVSRPQPVGGVCDIGAVEVMPPDLEIVKTVSNPTPSDGETITYTIIVSNVGEASATNITIVDDVPTGLTYVAGSMAGGDTQDDSDAPTLSWTASSLGAGEIVVITFQADVNNATTITNTATATSTETPTPVTATVTIVPGAGADLELNKSVAAGGLRVVVFTLDLTNQGPGTATGVVVSDVLQSAFTFTGASDTSYDATTGAWNVGTLTANTTATLVITANVSATGVYTNYAQVWHADQLDPDSTPGNNSTTEDDDDSIPPLVMEQLLMADLALTKSVDDDRPSVGDTVVFSITVTNEGPNDATGVALSDILPSGLGYSASEASDGSYSNGLWTLANTLGVGEAAGLIITATAEGPAYQAITNTVVVSALDQLDFNSTNDSASVSLTPQRYNVYLPLIWKPKPIFEEPMGQ